MLYQSEMVLDRQDSEVHIIVAITGASGAIYGVRMLEYLKFHSIASHLIISKSASLTISQETGLAINEIKEIADYSYHPSDIGARIASGSFKTRGMIIAPCSMNSLAAIAHGCEDNLISRAASVVLKERRKLVLMTRETPLHIGHIQNMLKVSEYGGIIAPPVPAFYNIPRTIDDIVNHSVARILDIFDIDIGIKRWNGMSDLVST